MLRTILQVLLSQRSKRIQHLPQDHKEIDACEPLGGGLWVEPAHVSPAGRGELEHGSLYLPCGGVDFPEQSMCAFEDTEIHSTHEKYPELYIFYFQLQANNQLFDSYGNLKVLQDL